MIGDYLEKFRVVFTYVLVAVGIGGGAIAVACGHDTAGWSSMFLVIGFGVREIFALASQKANQ